MIFCTYCSFQSDNNLLLVKHLFEAHSQERNFSYVCGFESCNHTFTMGALFDAFWNHCNQKHHDWQKSYYISAGEASGSATDINARADEDEANSMDIVDEAPIYDHMQH